MSVWSFNILVNCKVGSNLNLTCSFRLDHFKVTLEVHCFDWHHQTSMQWEDLKFKICVSDKNVQKIFYLCGFRHFLLKEVLGIIGVLTLTMKHMLVGSHSLSHSFSHLYSHTTFLSISHQQSQQKGGNISISSFSWKVSFYFPNNCFNWLLVSPAAPSQWRWLVLSVLPSLALLQPWPCSDLRNQWRHQWLPGAPANQRQSSQDILLLKNRLWLNLTGLEWRNNLGVPPSYHKQARERRALQSLWITC